MGAAKVYKNLNTNGGLSIKYGLKLAKIIKKIAIPLSISIFSSLESISLLIYNNLRSFRIN